ncbi:MAG: hypothetical protein PHT59_00550, partial [Candidatus Omnitrophica bacterium]|nr:hypothetical protein [Candidatus Omnitrophota bacterium]
MKWTVMVVVLLAGVAILYTDPLILDLARLFPGFPQSDTCLSAWNIWHLKQTLAAGRSPFNFSTGYIFYPQNPSLLLHNYILASGLASLPLQIFFSPVVSMNLIFLLQFVLCGLGMYLVCAHLTSSRPAALWAGITLAFCPYVISQSAYFLHFSNIWFFPWAIYFAWRFFDTAHAKFSAACGIVAGLCLLEDLTYFFFLTIILLLVAAFRLAVKPGVKRMDYFRNFAVGLPVFALITLAYLIQLPGAMRGMSSGFLRWPDAAVDYFSLHLPALLRPSGMLSLYRGLPFVPLPDALPTNVFIGYVPLFFVVFALAGLRNLPGTQRRVIFFWLATALIFFLIALGPLPFGKDHALNCLAPYRFVCAGPLRQLRIPVRFSLGAFIALYIIAAFGVARLLALNNSRRVHTTALCVFLLALQVMEFTPMPFPLINLEAPAAYRELASRSPSSPLLVLPLGWQSSYKTVGSYFTLIQFYQTVHGHPLFQGQIARIDGKYFDYYLSRPGFRYLMDADKKFPDDAERSDVARIIRDYGIKYAVIHTSYFDAQHVQALRQVFGELRGELSVAFVPKENSRFDAIMEKTGGRYELDR